jgi:hypothetical protein
VPEPAPASGDGMHFLMSVSLTTLLMKLMVGAGRTWSIV